MKKVLIIAYRFPPKSSIGSVRSGGLAKYLPDYGWQPIILTPAMPERSNRTLNFNVKLIETKYLDVLSTWRKRLGLNPDRSVTIQNQLGTAALNKKHSNLIKFFINFINNLITYPDEQKGWYPFAIKEAEEFLQKERVDAIISTSSPVTSHLIANYLKKKFNIPWIADFRDLWTQNHYVSHNFIRKSIERRLELKTLSLADALVTVSEPWAHKLRNLHKTKQVLCITNGFDPDNIKDTTVHLPPKFTITYTGKIYPGKQDISLLFRAVRQLLLEEKAQEEDFEIHFYGPDKERIESQAKIHCLQNIVKCHGQVSREVALNSQRSSQLLLLLIWDDKREPGVIPAKIFEYLASQRPILAAGGVSGSAAEILCETGAGVHATNMEDVKQFLLKCYRDFKLKGKVSYLGQKDNLLKYSHKEMAQKYAHVLSTLSHNSSLKSSH